MSETNPIFLVETLKETLRRYIATALPVSRRYPNLQKKIKEIIAQAPLVKGPFVEALPDFEKGKPLCRLLASNGGFLDDGFAALPEDLLDRPLHLHQEKALVKACQEEKSLIVATGTGSGKTECFLYPVAHRLMNDPEPDKPGVRVLLVYPMNALANDQLFYRIAPLFGRYLCGNHITFGRYTSQIKANVSRNDEEGRLRENEKLMSLLDNIIPGNWLLTREEMLETPPQILITNYAMLEHLLLLPRNASLFAENCLHTIILDEIHTYSGAQATEVAFLLRKLKTRLKSKNTLQVFGTSASLSAEPGSDEALLQFGADLFGEQVHEVIRGKRVPHLRLQDRVKTFSLTVDDWVTIGKIIEKPIAENYDVDGWRDELAERRLLEKIPRLDQKLDLPQALENVFRHNNEIRRVAKYLDKGSILPFQSLVKELFPGVNAKNGCGSQALSAIMHLGMQAKISEDSFPLLPIRYHISTNGIDGVSVCLAQTATEGWKAVKHYRHFTGDNGEIYYSLMVCRRCGQPYIEGFVVGNKLLNAKPVGGYDGKVKRKVFWLGEPAAAQVQDESDEDSAGAEEMNDVQVIFLDVATGMIVDSSEQTDGVIRLYEVETVVDEIERKNYVRTCKACGSQARGALAEIITPMQVGNEALGAVVTQQVLEALPGVKENAVEGPRPMQGRSLLTFSDNRQNAAYFAPYFERTSGSLALRTAIYQVLKNEDEPLNFEDLAQLVFRYWRKRGSPVVFNSDGNIIQNRTLIIETLLGQIAAEFCTPMGRRNSLESLGLVKVTYERQKLRRMVKAVKDILPDECQNQADELVHIFLENIRREKAITPLGDVDMRDPYLWGQAYKNHRAFELYKANPAISNAWIPPEGKQHHNRRTWYLVERLGWSWEATRRFLAEFWQLLNEQKILRPLNPGFGLDNSLIRFVSDAESGLFYCDNCGMLLFDAVASCCPAFRCRGKVHSLSPHERQKFIRENHYIHMMNCGQAMTVRAREHTAALSTDLRQKIEQEFSERKINVLSCTTTMEMGVDLGELEAVVCLNIPPGISNYQQRTGRAGRRAQAAPFCVTMARNSQYDQAVFREFKKYLEQSPPVPHVHLANAKLFQRHQNSIILSGYLRHRIENLAVNAPSLSDLFGDKCGKEDYLKFTDDLHHWLEGEGKQYIHEAEQLAARLPGRLKDSIALFGQALERKFTESVMSLADEVWERWRIYTGKRDEFADNEQYQMAASWDRLRQKYMEQFLVNQLSQHGMIPTYSFPVNSLTLEVSREFAQQPQFGAADVSLTRDAVMGIGEYAPGCEVVANGRIWSSAGLAYYPRDFMPTRYYVVCQECHHVEVAEDRESLACNCPFCGNSSMGMHRSFLEPHGFITSYRDRKGKDPSQNRIRKQYADEARLISLARDDQFVASDHVSISKALLLSHSPNDEYPVGTLFVVNRGPHGMGYHRCHLCNYMQAARSFKSVKVKHAELLSGKTCKNEKLSQPVDLSHVFNTDVCLLRIHRQLPLPEKKTILETKQQNYVESFARTLDEALRFAAAEILGLQAGALRATHKLSDRYLTVILYDAVAGGAGYVTRLFNEIKVNDLLKVAVDRLDCPNNCSSGCRSCLCDYSNQHYWDVFNRLPVLEWLQSIVGDQTAHPIIVQGGRRWEKPSLERLQEKLEKFPEVNIIARSLTSNETTADSKDLRLLLDLLNHGKQVKIFLSNQITDAKKRGHQERVIFSLLKPHIEQGKLSLLYLPTEIDLTSLPRIFTIPIDQGMFWFTDYPLPSAFDSLLPGPVYQLTGAIGNQQELSGIVMAAKKYPMKNIYPEKKQMRRWELRTGAKRNHHEYFSPIKGSYVEELVIKDPYCGAGDRQVGLLGDFIAEIFSLADTIKKIRIQCKEQNFKDKAYLPPAEIRKKIRGKIENKLESASEVKVDVVSFNYGRNFHDRSVIFRCINEDGIETKYIYDLSGGIDYLMDDSKNSILYCIVRE